MPNKPKFDAAQAITNELIACLERGTMPWRRPWNAAPSPQPLRHTGAPYQGINNFLLTLRGNLAGYASPYWMTLRQANEEGARIKKGARSSLVVYYGTSYKDAKDGDGDGSKDSGDTSDGDDHVEADRQNAIPFLKSYRVFNADQTEGLPDKFFPDAEPAYAGATPSIEPIPHMQAFFNAVGANVSYGGDRAAYVPALDQIRMPHLRSFESATAFYSVLGHEHVHWTKAEGRLNRVFGQAKFGNTAYAREEIVAELGTLFLGQHLGYAPAQVALSAAYVNSWLHVLRADKRAIFKHASDAARAAEYLIERASRGARDVAA